MKDIRKSIQAMELRRKAGLSRAEVAVALGVVENTVARWEQGKMTPHLSFDKVEILMNLYSCSIEDLVDAFIPEARDENASTSKDDSLPVAS